MNNRISIFISGADPIGELQAVVVNNYGFSLAGTNGSLSWCFQDQYPKINSKIWNEMMKFEKWAKGYLTCDS